MSKAVEELSKNLATGVSRRRALWRFATAVGAVAGLGFLTRGKAKATGAGSGAGAGRKQPDPFICYLDMLDEYEECNSLPPALQPPQGCFVRAEEDYEECLGGTA